MYKKNWVLWYWSWQNEKKIENIDVNNELTLRTNPPAKQLQFVMARGTGVDVTGCIILLQFCPKLTKV